MTKKVCVSCGLALDEDDFPLSDRYTKKDGTLVVRRRKVCKPCYAGNNRLRDREKKRDEFNRLLGWPCTLLSQ